MSFRSEFLLELKSVAAADLGTPPAGRIYIFMDTVSGKLQGTFPDAITKDIMVAGVSNNGSALTNLDASNLASGTIADARLSANVTVAGNSFNGASQLVQTTGAGALPAISGVNLTSLNASNISSGTLSIARGGTGAGTALAGFNALSPLTTKGDVLCHDGTNNIRLAVGTNGQVLSADSTQASGLRWIAVGVGTVTSVGLDLPSIFSVSGSPVVTAGTLTGTLVTQTANTIFAGPSSGGAATPTFRALTGADIVPGLNFLSVITNGDNSTLDANASTAVTTLTVSSSTNYRQATLLATGALTGTFIIFWSFEISNSTASTEMHCRLQNTTDTTTLGESATNPANAGGFLALGGVAEITLAGVSKNLEIQYKRVGGSGTITIKRAKILFMRKS